MKPCKAEDRRPLPHQKIVEQGLPPHPGPGMESILAWDTHAKERAWEAGTDEGILIVESMNISAMNTNGRAMWRRKADTILFQEHLMDESQKNMFAKQAEGEA